MIETERLELVPLTVELCSVESAGRMALARLLGVRVPESWPPPVFEADDIARLRLRLERAPEAARWTLYYLVLRATPGIAVRDLIGVAGFPDPPSESGEIDIGYAVAAEHQGKGYATEAVRALIAHALAHPTVKSIRATTYPELIPSLRVLAKTGFTQTGPLSAAGLLIFQRRADRQA